MQSRHLELSQVGIDFPTPKGPFTALTDVNLKIEKGEFISLIGHSGCGKSTVLNIVAGLHQATTGGVILDGAEVKEPAPRTCRGVSEPFTAALAILLQKR